VRDTPAVSPRIPDGEPAPRDGALPAAALAGVGVRPFGVYVHVPFCASRCGYCDFNTYVPGEGASRGGFVDAVLSEWALAQRVLGGAPAAATVFLGGGTPTLLPDTELARLLDAIPRVDGAEVTIEANPDTVDLARLRTLRRAGATRISLGMQSASAHVLAALERTHTPGAAVAAARHAREAGFEHISLDLIYGTPGERDADWAATLAAALEAGVDHVSAYALTLEPGTRLHAQVRRGRLPLPDDDAQARRYRQADAALAAAGLGWYEISNWAAHDGARCAHNLGYWRSHDWWGLGPGAHSHVGGVRWWNVLHPARYARAAAARTSPAAGRERLTAAQRATERTMLGVRLADGLELTGPAEAAARLAAGGLLEPAALARGVARLTLEGRLLADRVARDLLEFETDLSHRCHPACDAAPGRLGHLDAPPADLRLRAEFARPLRHRRRSG
jgi:putative oxygen-independent coproporphyrinogen III oxidase